MLATAACSVKTSAASPPPPPEVRVATVEQRDVTIYHEWIGTLDGMVNAAIRAEVTGYLLSQNYAEGSFVRKGQSLFEIDAEAVSSRARSGAGTTLPGKSTAWSGQGAIGPGASPARAIDGRSEKNTTGCRQVHAARPTQAVTQQDLDNAVQNNVSSKAKIEAGKAGVETARAQIEASAALVESAQAAVEAAKVNIGFTHLVSPIDGIAGLAQVQVGNLVSPSSGVITTVSTLDPIKANFTVGEQEYLSLTRGGGNDLAKMPLGLILADGSVYPQKGKFFFADRQVNQNTGAIQLTGLFPNPGNRLRPGQYGKVRAAIGISAGALLIPQRAVMELQGSYQVAVVDSADKVDIRTVKVGDRIGSKWIVSEGLKAGERVVAEGAQQARPGMQVSPKPYVGGN